MRFFRRALAGLFLLSLTLGLLALGGWTVFQAVQTRMAEEPGGRPASEQVYSAQVTRFQPRRVTPVLTVFGEVRSRRTLQVRAPVEGRVVELAPDFRDGGRLDAGDLLLRVDPTDAQAALANARADVAQAEAELRDAETGVDLARQEVEAAQGQVALQSRALARQQDLLERGVGSAATVEQAEVSLASAEQQVLSRRQALASAEAARDAAQTALARARIAVRGAERDLADTELRADFAGVLSDVSVIEGGLVSRNEQIATLIDSAALEVAFRVSTSQYARLLDAAGDLPAIDATVVLDVLGMDITAPATLTRESAEVADGLTGRLLFATLSTPRGFRPGDFVAVQVSEPALSEVAVLPATALNGQNEVLVVGADNRLEVAEVDLLRRQGDDVIVRAQGLAGRDVVVTRSPVLGAGIRINPLRPDVPDAPDANAAAMQDDAGTIALTPERRARLVAFVEQNGRIPQEVRERLLDQLAAEEVDAETVANLEARMGS